jgi:hypothetical protein
VLSLVLAALWRKFLKTRILPIVIATTCWASFAAARPQPAPPPSGIVVHLFGPDSVASNFLPADGSGNTAQGSKAEGAQAGGGAQGTGPTMHGILHEMFVTGDPNMTPGQALSKGKTGGE